MIKFRYVMGKVIKIMPGKRDERELSESVAEIFQEYPYIVAAYQFGSTVRSQHGPMSDLDIAILLEEDKAPSGADLIREEGLLAYKVGALLGYREVDLIDINTQNVTFQHNILRTGRLIYDRDPDHRVKFEWKVITAYLDFQPTRRLIERFHTIGRLKRCGII